jgi:uroporphyrinogen-III synthase
MDLIGARPLALVTRPEPQASSWVEALAERGHAALALPLLEIAPAADPAAARAVWQALEPGDVLMFVSPAAAASFFGSLSGPSPWPSGALAAATGPGTVQSLMKAGVPREAIVAPPADAAQFDSEALWACLSAEPWAGRRVWIVRGEGGRDWLASRWAEAGAQVAFLETYQRREPVWSEAQAASAQAAVAAPESAVWLISSSESLKPLARLLPEARWSLCCAWVSHPRIAEAALTFGFGRALLIRPGVAAVVEALEADPTIRRPW